MIKLLKSKIKYRSFHKAVLAESTEIPANPLRGWFDLYAFELDGDTEQFKNEAKERMDNDVNLILLLADISAYKGGDIADGALYKLEQVISFFRENNKDIILRVTYDHAGKGMEREPFSFDIVKKHAEVIAGFVRAHHEDIFLYQGLLIGKWGEMHTSRFLSIEKLCELHEIFEKGLQGSVYTAVRKPAILRNIKGEPDNRDSFDPGTLGIFNDGMFGSDTDLGTYDSSEKDCRWDKPWNRENEHRFTAGIAEKVPVGGEALFGEGFVSTHTPKDYIDELALQHITYLNRHHDVKLINYWKKTKVSCRGIWNGRSYFDYIGAHLGYRFFVKNAAMYRKKDDCFLKIVVENQGFAPLYKKSDLYVIVKEDNGSIKRICAEAQGLNGISPDEQKEIEFVIPKIKGKIFLYACIADTGKNIYFSNQGSHAEGVLLGNMT